MAQHAIARHVHPRRQESRQLNLRFLDRLVARTEALLDARLLDSYSPGTVQAQETRRHYGADEIEAVVHAARDAADAELAEIRAEARKRRIELPFDVLVRDAELSPLESDIFQLALAPMLDASFRKRIALFRDNMLQSYVDVDLALTLMLPTRLERLGARELFDPTGRLLRHKLIELVHPKDALTTEHLLAYEARVPARVVSYVLGHEAIDDAILPFARLTLPAVPFEQVVLSQQDLEEISGLLDHYSTYREDAARIGLREVLSVGQSLVIQLSGPPGTGKSLLVQAIASRLDRRLLTIECGKLAAEDKAFGDKVDKLFFEARQRSAVLCFDGCEALFSHRNPRAATVYRHFEEHDGIVLLVTNEPQEVDFALERWVAYHLKLEIPDPTLREAIWRQHLPANAPLAGDIDLKGLAQQFEFSGGQIRNAVLIALNRALARGGDVLIDQALLDRSAHAQLRADMDEVSHRSRVHLTLEDLVLPKEDRALVQEVLNACKVRNFVMTHWGFGRRLSTGKGLVILFSGEPGTGKTLCAEILASSMSMAIYRVSIPRIMSKWVGETEKNISKIFSKARASHSMLLFDEADALFTSRVKVESSVDRFANMETNLLLQEIERFEGVCILTTNHEKNIDEAFKRRIGFKIHFPFPDDKHRALIWRTLIPRECPVEPDIDFELLGKNFELSGGYIKNAIVRAAYRAAVAQVPMSMRHIEQSAEQECKNAGKIFRSLENSSAFGSLL